MRQLNQGGGLTFPLSLVCSSAAFAQDAIVNGEVKKVDETAEKITLKHDAIKNLGMDEDGMTMAFRVQDPAMLKQVKVGDKVKLAAERGSDGIAITKMQKEKQVRSHKNYSGPMVMNVG
jgi:Cu(I)/Ag(I) efflux system protein CusF